MNPPLPPIRPETIRTVPSAAGAADRDGGNITVELVLLTPVFFALLAVIVGLGRIAESRGQVVGAARDAARAASQQRNPQAASTAADAAARADLTLAGLTCQQLTVSTDTAAFVPGGVVRVTVGCTANLSDLIGVGLPSHKTLTSTSAAPLEQFRGLQP